MTDLGKYNTYRYKCDKSTVTNEQWYCKELTNCNTASNNNGCTKTPPFRDQYTTCWATDSSYECPSLYAAVACAKPTRAANCRKVSIWNHMGSGNANVPMFVGIGVAAFFLVLWGGRMLYYGEFLWPWQLEISS
tara:strand:- start:41 stop:442 length:402 start_codon:yes stop_codon:yes gene_type:complete